MEEFSKDIYNLGHGNVLKDSIEQMSNLSLKPIRLNPRRLLGVMSIDPDLVKLRGDKQFQASSRNWAAPMRNVLPGWP